jgi:hypothetical protein
LEAAPAFTHGSQEKASPAGGRKPLEDSIRKGQNMLTNAQQREWHKPPVTVNLHDGVVRCGQCAAIVSKEDFGEPRALYAIRLPDKKGGLGIDAIIELHSLCEKLLEIEPTQLTREIPFDVFGI